ncbi:MAG: YoaP domain-containing protein [Lachnospiraceae bacterium]
MPCVFNNRAVFPNGKFVTVNQTDGAAPEKILRRGGK